MTNYKIMTCPSDNSEQPTVYERGHTFISAANDRAWELAAEDSENDYWPEEDTDIPGWD